MRRLAPASELGAPALAVLDPAAPAAVSGPRTTSEGWTYRPFSTDVDGPEGNLGSTTRYSGVHKTHDTHHIIKPSQQLTARNRAGCALTALPCAAVYCPTVLRFDVAIGQRPSARFEGDAAKHHTHSGAATVTSEVTPPTQRRSRKRVHQESSYDATRSGEALIARGFRLLPCPPHRNTIASLRHRPLSTSAAVGIPRFHYFDRPCSALDGSLPSHGYLGGYALPLARHAPCKSITPFHSIIPEHAPAAVVVSL